MKNKNLLIIMILILIFPVVVFAKSLPSGRVYQTNRKKQENNLLFYEYAIELEFPQKYSMDFAELSITSDNHDFKDIESNDGWVLSLNDNGNYLLVPNEKGDMVPYAKNSVVCSVWLHEENAERDINVKLIKVQEKKHICKIYPKNEIDNYYFDNDGNEVSYKKYIESCAPAEKPKLILEDNNNLIEIDEKKKLIYFSTLGMDDDINYIKKCLKAENGMIAYDKNKLILYYPNEMVAATYNIVSASQYIQNMTDILILDYIVECDYRFIDTFDDIENSQILEKIIIPKDYSKNIEDNKLVVRNELNKVIYSFSIINKSTYVNSENFTFKKNFYKYVEQDNGSIYLGKDIDKMPFISINDDDKNKIDEVIKNIEVKNGTIELLCFDYIQLFPIYYFAIYDELGNIIDTVSYCGINFVVDNNEFYDRSSINVDYDVFDGEVLREDKSNNTIYPNTVIKTYYSLNNQNNDKDDASKDKVYLEELKLYKEIEKPVVPETDKPTDKPADKPNSNEDNNQENLEGEQNKDTDEIENPDTGSFISIIAMLFGMLTISIIKISRKNKKIYKL